MELRYRVNIEPDEDGVFVATVPALPGVVDQGETEEEALKNIAEALDFTVTDMVERGEEIPPSDAGRGVVREVDLVVWLQGGEATRLFRGRSSESL